MILIKTIFVCAGVLVTACTAVAQRDYRTLLPDVMAGRFTQWNAQEGCFIAHRLSDGLTIRSDGDVCDRRHVPASTFKILNALIALEARIVEDEHEVLVWDGVDRGIRGWNRDHDLASAFQASAVWFYQEIARRIGGDRMERYLTGASYGNGTVGDVIDRFWLDGPLLISPAEQITFLRKLFREELPFSRETIETVKRIMELERNDSGALYGKTGWARGDRQTGWLVGFVEAGGEVWLYASLVRAGPDFPMWNARFGITYSLLRDLGIFTPENIPAPQGSASANE